MAGLTLDHFLQSGQDFESAQYRILSGLQDVRRAFAQNVIYPHLGSMIEVYATLQSILQRARDLQDVLPRTVRKIDVEQKRLIYEQEEPGPSQMRFIEDLIHWALPHIQEAIEEGRAIFEFVEENLRVAEVGLVPSYVEEGYLLVPERRGGLLHVLQYSLSIFQRADERYRTLRTSYVKSIAQGTLYHPPVRVKLELMAENRDLPNPATFFLDTDLDFPFEETLLPVAKRKLMRYLYDAGGAA